MNFDMLRTKRTGHLSSVTHREDVVGHPGIERMKAIARSHVFWPKIDNAIEAFVRECNNCASHSKTPRKVPLQSWPQTASPWERIHIDFAGPFFDQYFLVVVDAHSKWPEVQIVRSPTTSSVTEFLDELFSRFGVPSTVVSDNGSQFTSEQFAAFCKSNGIQHLRTAPYHPQSNGQAERFVDTLKRSLLKINEGEKIAKTLQVFLQTYRSTPSRILQGKSPAELILGRKMRTALSLLQPTQRIPTVVNQQQNDQFNKKHGVVSRSFQAGDKIYAKVYSANKWTWSAGVVIEAFGHVNYNVLLDNQHGRRKLIRSHANQLKWREVSSSVTDSSRSPLSILVDMFGLQSKPIPVQDTIPVETAGNQEISDISDVRLQATNEDDHGPEANQQESESIPSVTPEVRIRPKRTIRMPSRFEPYWVLRK